jgi:hypothetical protein
MDALDYEFVEGRDDIPEPPLLEDLPVGFLNVSNRTFSYPGFYANEGEYCDMVQNAMAWFAAEDACRMFDN